MLLEGAVARTWKGISSPSLIHTSLTCVLWLGWYCKPVCVCVCVCVCVRAQSCPTLRDPVDCSPPGSSVHGISQTWILEWVASSFWNSFSDQAPLVSCAFSCFHWFIVYKFIIYFFFFCVAHSLILSPYPTPKWLTILICLIHMLLLYVFFFKHHCSFICMYLPKCNCYVCSLSMSSWHNVLTSFQNTCIWVKISTLPNISKSCVYVFLRMYCFVCMFFLIFFSFKKFSLLSPLFLLSLCGLLVAVHRIFCCGTCV